MLVLTRKCSEVIRIGDDILVKVVRTGKTAVKIGIEAPDHVRVLRGELVEHDVPAPRIDLIDFSDAALSHFALNHSDQYPHAV